MKCREPFKDNTHRFHSKLITLTRHSWYIHTYMQIMMQCIMYNVKIWRWHLNSRSILVSNLIAMKLLLEGLGWIISHPPHSWWMFCTLGIWLKCSFQMRKMHWEEQNTSRYIIKCLTAVWNAKFYNIRCIANLVAGLISHHVSLSSLWQHIAWPHSVYDCAPLS